MPVVKEVNFKGEVIGDFELSDAVFGAPVHVPAMHQVVVAHLANCRVGTHNTKDRGDVAAAVKSPGDRNIQVVPVQAAHVRPFGSAAELLMVRTRETIIRR
jgi:ribosomal protein L4